MTPTASPSSTNWCVASDRRSSRPDALDGVARQRRADTNALDGGVFSKKLDVVDHQHGAGLDRRAVGERDVLSQHSAPELGLEGVRADHGCRA